MDEYTAMIYCQSSKTSLQTELAKPFGNVFRKWVNDNKSNPHIIKLRTIDECVDLIISQTMYDLEKAHDNPQSMMCVAWHTACTTYMITQVVPYFSNSYDEIFKKAFVLYYNDLKLTPID